MRRERTRESAWTAAFVDQVGDLGMNYPGRVSTRPMPAAAPDFSGGVRLQPDNLRRKGKWLILRTTALTVLKLRADA